MRGWWAVGKGEEGGHAGSGVGGAAPDGVGEEEEGEGAGRAA